MWLLSDERLGKSSSEIVHFGIRTYSYRHPPFPYSSCCPYQTSKEEIGTNF